MPQNRRMLPAPQTASHPLPGTVLIVDDDRAVLESYRRMLQLEGYMVVTAQNAQDGLREAHRHSPDAIILDLRMPLTDGLAFLRRLRAKETHRTPVAIVTGDYLIDDRVVADLEALEAEIKFKPLWLEDLVALARTLVKTKPQATPALRR